MEPKSIHRHVFIFNPQDNGGEALSLVTDFIGNGDGEIYTSQELTLHSYCNAATFILIGSPITSNSLRKLADELDCQHDTALELVRTKEELKC